MNEFDDILLETNEMDFDIDNIIQDQNSPKLTYDQLKEDLLSIKDKSAIKYIKKSNYSLHELKGNTFNGFNQLIDLDLSHNLLTSLSKDAFDELCNLQIIDLSHNLITELNNSLFENNKQLRVINLSNNCLKNINNYTFENLNLLRKLDFSYNRIEMITKQIIDSESLQELNLGYNQIYFIKANAFINIPNLIYLQLNNNKIRQLTYNWLINTTKIEYLNLSNNLIRKVEKRTFVNLHNLKQIDFSNNSLIALGKCLENKLMLNQLNLLNNPLSKFWLKDLLINKNIRTLKLTIHEYQKLEKLRFFELLSDFELHVTTRKKFSVNRCVLPWINVATIQRLYMVIQKGIFNVKNEISNLLILEILHIEFLEPIIHLVTFNIGFHINHLPKLKYLALININKLQITNDDNIQQNNIIYLNLTGIENVSANFLQNNFLILEYLNLSKSHVSYISRDLLETLPNLKYLIMNNTRIFILIDNLFQYNKKLETIDFRDCEIRTIGENCFQNLENLNQIDIRGNIKLRITQSLLNGIPKSAVVYYD